MDGFATGRWERNLYRIRNEFLPEFVMSQMLSGLPENFPLLRVLYKGLSELRNDQLLSQIVLERELTKEIQARTDGPMDYDINLPRIRVDQRALHSRFPDDYNRYSSEVTRIFTTERVPATTTETQPSWNTFAQRLDGYELSKRLGQDFDIGSTVIEHHNRTGKWKGSYIDLRLALFFRARELHWVNYNMERETDIRMSIESLLYAIKHY